MELVLVTITITVVVLVIVIVVEGGTAAVVVIKELYLSWTNTVCPWQWKVLNTMNLSYNNSFDIKNHNKKQKFL